MAEKRIYLIRHGETDFNHKRIVQGSGVDAPLNEAGKAQARAFFNAYRNVPFDRVISSVLRRSIQTVDPFIETGIPHEMTPLINEINWGTHEGKVSTPDMIRRYEDMIAAWASGDLDASLPMGESARQLFERIEAFIAYLAGMDGSHILVCSHGRAMRAMITLFKNAPAAYMEEVRHANTGLYLIERGEDNWEIILENETTHL